MGTTLEDLGRAKEPSIDEDKFMTTMGKFQDDLAKYYKIDIAKGMENFQDKSKEVVEAVGGEFTFGIMKMLGATNAKAMGVDKDKLDNGDVQEYAKVYKHMNSEIALAKFKEQINAGAEFGKAFASVKELLRQNVVLMRFDKDADIERQKLYQRHLTRYQSVDSKGKKKLGYRDIDITQNKDLAEVSKTLEDRNAGKTYVTDSYKKVNEEYNLEGMFNDVDTEQIIGSTFFVDFLYNQRWFGGSDITFKRDLSRDLALQTNFEGEDVSGLATAVGIGAAIGEHMLVASATGGLGSVAAAAGKASAAAKIVGGLAKVKGLSTLLTPALKLASTLKVSPAIMKTAYFVGKGAYQDVARNDGLARQYDKHYGEYIGSRVFDAFTYVASEAVLSPWLEKKIVPNILKHQINNITKGAGLNASVLAKKALAKTEIAGGILTGALDVASDYSLDMATHHLVRKGFAAIGAENPFTMQQRLQFDKMSVEGVLNAVTQRLGSRVIGGTIGRAQSVFMRDRSKSAEDIVGTYAYSTSAYNGEGMKQLGAKVGHVISQAFGGTQLKSFDITRKQWQESTGKQLSLAEYVGGEKFKYDAFAEEYAKTVYANNVFHGLLFGKKDKLELSNDDISKINVEENDYHAVLSVLTASREGQYSFTARANKTNNIMEGIDNLFKDEITKIAELRSDPTQAFTKAEQEVFNNTMAKKLSFVAGALFNNGNPKVMAKIANVLQNRLNFKSSGEGNLKEFDNKVFESKTIIDNFLNKETDTDKLNIIRGYSQDITLDDRKEYTNLLNSNRDTDKLIDLDVPYNIDRIRAMLKGGDIKGKVERLKEIDIARRAKTGDPSGLNKEIVDDLSKVLRDLDDDNIITTDKVLIEDMVKINEKMKDAYRKVVDRTIAQLRIYKDNSGYKESVDERAITILLQKLHQLVNIGPHDTGKYISDELSKEGFNKDMSKLLATFDNKTVLGNISPKLKSDDPEDNAFGSYIKELAQDSYIKRVQRGVLSLFLRDEQTKNVIDGDDLILMTSDGPRINLPAAHSMLNSQMQGTSDVNADDIKIKVKEGSSNEKDLNKSDFQMAHSVMQRLAEDEFILHSDKGGDVAKRLTYDEIKTLVSSWIHKAINVAIHDSKNHKGGKVTYDELRVAARDLVNDVLVRNELDDIVKIDNIDGEIFKVARNMHNDVLSNLDIDNDADMYKIGFSISGNIESNKMKDIQTKSAEMQLANKEFMEMTSNAAEKGMVTDGFVATDTGEHFFIYGNQFKSDYTDVVKDVTEETGLGFELEAKAALLYNSLGYEEAVKRVEQLIWREAPVIANQLDKQSSYSEYNRALELGVPGPTTKLVQSQLKNFVKILVNQAAVNTNVKYTVGLTRNLRTSGELEKMTDAIIDINATGNIKGITQVSLTLPEDQEIDADALWKQGILLGEHGGASLTRMGFAFPKSFYSDNKKHNKLMVVNLLNSLQERGGMSTNRELLKEFVKDENSLDKGLLKLSDLKDEYQNRSNELDSKSFASLLVKKIAEIKAERYKEQTKDFDGTASELKLVHDRIYSHIDKVETDAKEILSRLSPAVTLLGDGGKEVLKNIARIFVGQDDPLLDRIDAATGNGMDILKDMQDVLGKDIGAILNLNLGEKGVVAIRQKINALKEAINNSKKQFNITIEEDRKRIFLTEEEYEIAYRAITKEAEDYNKIAQNAGIVSREDLTELSNNLKGNNVVAPVTQFLLKKSTGSVKVLEDWVKDPPKGFDALSKIYSYITLGDEMLRAGAPAKRVGGSVIQGVDPDNFNPAMKQLMDSNIKDTRVVVIGQPIHNGKEMNDGTVGFPKWIRNMFAMFSPSGSRNKVTVNTSAWMIKMQAYGNADFVGKAYVGEDGNTIRIKEGDIVLNTSAIKGMDPMMLRLFGIDPTAKIKPGQARVWDDTNTASKSLLSDYELAKDKYLTGGNIDDSKVNIELMKNFVGSLSTHANLSSNVKKTNISDQAGWTDRLWDLTYKESLVNTAKYMDGVMNELQEIDFYVDPNSFWKRLQSKIRRPEKVNGASIMIAGKQDFRTGDVNLYKGREMPDVIPPATIGHRLLIKQLMLYQDTNKKVGPEVRETIQQLISVLDETNNSYRQLGNYNKNGVTGDQLVTKALDILADESNGKQALVVKSGGHYYATFTRFPAQRKGQAGWFIIDGVKREETGVDLMLDPFYTEKMQNTDYDGDKASWIALGTKQMFNIKRKYLKELEAKGLLSDNVTPEDYSLTNFFKDIAREVQVNHTQVGNGHYSIASPKGKEVLKTTDDIHLSVGSIINGAGNALSFTSMHSNANNKTISSRIYEEIQKTEWDKIVSEGKANLGPVQDRLHITTTEMGGIETWGFLKEDPSGVLKSVGSVERAVTSQNLITLKGESGTKNYKRKPMLALLDQGNNKVVPMLILLKGDDGFKDDEFLQSNFGVAIDRAYKFDEIDRNAMNLNEANMIYAVNAISKSLDNSPINKLERNIITGVSEASAAISLSAAKKIQLGNYRMASSLVIEEQGQNAGVNQAKNYGATFLLNKYPDGKLGNVVKDVIIEAYAGAHVKIADIGKEHIGYTAFMNKGVLDKVANDTYGYGLVDRFVNKINSDNNGRSISWEDFTKISTFTSKSMKNSKEILEASLLAAKYIKKGFLDPGKVDILPGKIEMILRRANALLSNGQDAFFGESRLKRIVNNDEELRNFYDIDQEAGGVVNMKVYEVGEGKVKRKIYKVQALTTVDTGVKYIQHMFGEEFSKLIPSQAMRYYGTQLGEKTFLARDIVPRNEDGTFLTKKEALGNVIEHVRKVMDNSSTPKSTKWITDRFREFGIDISVKTDTGAGFANKAAIVGVRDPGDEKEYNDLRAAILSETPDIDSYVLSNNKGEAFSVDGLIMEMNKHLLSLTTDSKMERPKDLEASRNMIGAMMSTIQKPLQETLYLRTRGYDLNFVHKAGAMVRDGQFGKPKYTDEGIKNIVTGSSLFTNNKSDIPLDFFGKNLEHFGRIENTIRCK